MDLDEIKKRFQTKRDDLSSFTINIYISCIKKILELMNTDDINIILNNPDEVIKTIEKHYNNFNSRKTKLGALLSYLNLLKRTKALENIKSKYLSKVEEYNNAIKNKLQSHEKNEKEMESIPTKEDYEQLETKLFDALPKKYNDINDYFKIRDYVIFKLYQALPSRLDFADTKLIFSNDNMDNEDDNYLVLDKKNKTIKYHLNNYKTSKVYGKKILNIDSNLYNLLVEYKKVLNKFSNSNYLFLNQTGRKLTRNYLSKLYKKLGSENIGKNITVSGNRHKAVSDLIPIEKMQELSYRMGHDLNEAVNVYSKT
jgi:hypothetical protein